MGQAKQRQKAMETWLNGLSPIDQSIASASLKLHRAFPFDGACYRMSFFLNLFLSERLDVTTEVVVGFANDGTDNMFMSHAWVEYQNRKIDLAICRPLQPDLQRRGALVVLDHAVAPGWPGYTYHLNRPSAAIAEMEEMAKDEHVRKMFEAANDQHQFMLQQAASAQAMRRFLDDAPDGLTYDKIVALVDG